MAGPVAFYAADPIQSTQLIPGGNVPASGAQLFVYLPGTSQKQNSYTDPSASTARTNPIVLDSGGNVPGNGEVWLVSSAKFVLAPSNDTDPPTSPYWTRDNVPGINNIAAQLAAISTGEWVQGSTATFVGVTAFSVVGDQTLLYTTGRRVKVTVTGGDRFGIVTSQTFATGTTTVGITTDSGTLNGGLSAVSYGILSTPNGSVPWTQLSSTGVFFESPITTGAFTGNSTAVWGSGIANYGILTKIKVTSQSTSNSTNFIADTTLTFPILANETWTSQFIVNRIGTTLNATGVKLAITAPAGSTSQATVFFSGISVGECQSVPLVTTQAGAFVWGAGNASGQGGAIINSWVANGTTAGNVTLNWAPQSSAASVLTLFPGAFVNATRTA